MMTAKELLSEFERYLKKYPKGVNEKPLQIKADIDDTYHTVSLKTLPVSAPSAVVFERIGFSEALSVSSVKAALDGLPDKTIGVVIDSGVTRYEVVSVAADKKQTLILQTRKTF